MKSGIYRIRNLITNKLYIGKACFVKKRINTHKWLLRHNKHVNIHLQHAWNKYGSSSFVFEIIEHCEIEDLPIREDYWTRFYDSTNPERGYNLMVPGRQNYNHSEETKEKMRIRKLGRKMSEEHLKNNTLSKYKPVLQFTKSGEFVREWLGASYIRDELGYNQGNITAVCNGKRKAAHGYIWKYKE